MFAYAGGRLFELGTMLLIVARIRRWLVRIARGLSRLLLRRREVDKVASSSSWLWLEDSRLCLMDSWLLQLETAGSLLEFTARWIDDATRQRLCSSLEDHYFVPEK